MNKRMYVESARNLYPKARPKSYTKTKYGDMNFTRFVLTSGLKSARSPTNPPVAPYA